MRCALRVEFYLPLYDNSGQSFDAEIFLETREELARRFGGVSAYDALVTDYGYTKADSIRTACAYFSPSSTTPLTTESFLKTFNEKLSSVSGNWKC